MIPGITASRILKKRGGQIILNLKAGPTSTIVPAGVTSICAVVVGKPGTPTVTAFPNSQSRGGGGGALAYKNNIPVSPGQQLRLDVIGNQTVLRVGATSNYLLVANNGVLHTGGAATVAAGVTSFKGGDAAPTNGKYTYTGGGGAGGFAGPGADSVLPTPAPATGTLTAVNGLDGTGGSGGSGASVTNPLDSSSLTTGSFGGPVQLYGLGANGKGGGTGNTGDPGSAMGYNGGIGSQVDPLNNTTNFGGGAPGVTGAYNDYPGGCRIIWGAGRSFPNDSWDV